MIPILIAVPLSLSCRRQKEAPNQTIAIAQSNYVAKRAFMSMLRTMRMAVNWSNKSEVVCPKIIVNSLINWTRFQEEFFLGHC